MKSKGNYIGGKWIISEGISFSSISPIDNSVIWSGNISTKEDIDAAINSATLAFDSWASLEVESRIEYIKKFVDVLKEHKEELASIITIEVGKPIWESISEVESMISKLEPSIDAYIKRNSIIVKELQKGVSKTRFLPHGVVLVVGPYNFPAHMSNSHIMPALISGNTIILKPSELGAKTAEKVIEYWETAGLPDGVINLIQGDGTVGEILVKDERIKAVFFTGSYKVGNKIIDLVGNKKLCALEMGGNSPLLVWDTSDINSAVYNAIQSSLITSGQRCSSARRIIIPDNEFGNNFINKFIDVVKKIDIGVPNKEPYPYMGPLRNSIMVEKILNYQEALINKGAIPLLIGRRLQYGNSYMSPSIIDITNLTDNTDDEIIGPFIKVIRVKDFDSAIKVCNDTKYGLAAGIFTEDEELYKKFYKEVKAGVINWNQQLTGSSAWAPFGGLKSSGNYHPSGYLSTDYTVYSVASIENNILNMPSKLPSGLKF